MAQLGTIYMYMVYTLIRQPMYTRGEYFLKSDASSLENREKPVCII